MASRVLTQMFAFGLFDKAPQRVDHGQRHHRRRTSTCARRGAQEGTVLLKNNGVLPLSTATTHSIAVLGVDGGAGVQSVGGGSATATSSGTVWPLTGIQNRVAGTGTTVQYNDGSNVAQATTLAQNSDVAIVFASNNYGNEGSDQSSIDLPGNQNQLISSVAAANPRTIVVLHTNSAIDHAVAGPGGRGVRGLLRRPAGRHRDRRAAVRRRQPVRQAAGHRSRGVSPTCPRTRPRSGRARTTRSSTPRGSRSATAGTTRRTSRRCSPSGSACPTPRSASATCRSAR